jgi:sulfite reductase (ferredoxin)
VILKIIELYRQQKSESETLHQWVTKVTKGQATGSIKNLEDMKAALAQVIQLPAPDKDPDAYMDYGSDSRFSAKTAGGECAA